MNSIETTTIIPDFDAYQAAVDSLEAGNPLSMEMLESIFGETVHELFEAQGETDSPMVLV